MKKTIAELNITDIPWEQLTTAYGSGAEIPDLIAQKEYVELLNLIEHQDTLWQTTPWAILFLLKELEKNQLAEAPVELIQIFITIVETCQTYEVESIAPTDIVLEPLELLTEKYLWSEAEDLEAAWDEEEPKGYDTQAFTSYYWYSYRFIAEKQELFKKLKKTENNREILEELLDYFG